MVSSDFGKLEASRQRMAACACTAGATPAARIPAMPADWMRERRSMSISCLFVTASDAHDLASARCALACRLLTERRVRQRGDRENGDRTTERRGRRSYAEDAKEFKKKNSEFLSSFCVLCVIFASSAFGC